jgi:4-amino-4-deoxy-L-arabinose transferase-like glycosyltransferase
MGELQRTFPGTIPQEPQTARSQRVPGTEQAQGVTSRAGRIAVYALPAGLYLVSAGLLLLRIGDHPAFTYNWENSTAYGLFAFAHAPTPDVFKLSQGLMTDSGESPLVVLPAWLGFLLGGVSLAALRAPVALLAALAVPLTWAIGRRAVGPVPAALGAVLLALSPVFLLYSRTATTVGISLVPVLAGVYALLRVLKSPGDWRWTAALVGALLAVGYGYAPARFLWLIAVALLVLEAFLRCDRRERRALLVAAGATTLLVAGAITALDFEHHHDPVLSVGYYYAGRGEQMANLLFDTADFAHTVRGIKGDPPPTAELAGQLLTKNVFDMANLLLDRETQPALLDYWNPHGRLYPAVLVPFLLLGLGRALWRARRREGCESRAIAAMFLGFTLPMVLTSQVHIGRLLFAVPFLCLLAAEGFVWAAGIFGQLAPRLTREPESSTDRTTLLATVLSCAALVFVVALLAWRDYGVEVPLTREARATRMLAQDAPEIKALGGAAVMVTVGDNELTLEAIDAGQYRVALNGQYRFYNLATGEGELPTPGDSRPALYIGGLLDRLKDPSSIPTYCLNTYYVLPDAWEDFEALRLEHAGLCDEPLVQKMLP